MKEKKKKKSFGHGETGGRMSKWLNKGINAWTTGKRTIVPASECSQRQVRWSPRCRRNRLWPLRKFRPTPVCVAWAVGRQKAAAFGRAACLNASSRISVHRSCTAVSPWRPVCENVKERSRGTEGGRCMEWVVMLYISKQQCLRYMSFVYVTSRICHCIIKENIDRRILNETKLLISEKKIEKNSSK